MKYVSAITYEGEEAINHIGVELSDALCLTVCDTDKIGAKDVSGDQLCSLRAVGFYWDFDSVAVVRHSQKEVMLHRFIASAGTRYDNYKVVNKDSDFVRFDIGCVDLSDVVGGKDLIIDTDMRAIELCGQFGSVAITSSPILGGQRVISLYDMLCRVCGITGMNIMKYNQITFFSTTQKYKTTISLIHSSEANTFFTKMYMMDGVKNALHE